MQNLDTLLSQLKNPGIRFDGAVLAVSNLHRRAAQAIEELTKQAIIDRAARMKLEAREFSYGPSLEDAKAEINKVVSEENLKALC